MPDTKRIGVIGLGTIATALVKGIAGDGHDITVSTRSTANSTRLAGQFGNVTVAENQQVLDVSDTVFLGVTGDAASGTLESLRFREGQQVVSLMADLGFDMVANMVAPAAMAARMIPFPLIATGGSPILTFGDRSLIDDLFGARNSVFALDSEAELGSYLCAQAVLSPAVSMVRDAADWLARNDVSDPETAEAFLRTLVGASLLGSPCAKLLHALDTPGGYNQRLRQHMRDAGLMKTCKTASIAFANDRAAVHRRCFAPLAMPVRHGRRMLMTALGECAAKARFAPENRRRMLASRPVVSGVQIFSTVTPSPV